MGDYGIELDGWGDYMDAQDEERWWDGYEAFQYQKWRAENPEAAAAEDAECARWHAELEAERAATATTADAATAEAASDSNTETNSSVSEVNN